MVQGVSRHALAALGKRGRVCVAAGCHTFEAAMPVAKQDGGERESLAFKLSCSGSLAVGFFGSPLVRANVSFKYIDTKEVLPAVKSPQGKQFLVLARHADLQISVEGSVDNLYMSELKTKELYIEVDVMIQGIMVARFVPRVNRLGYFSVILNRFPDGDSYRSLKVTVPDSHAGPPLSLSDQPKSQFQELEVKFQVVLGRSEPCAASSAFSVSEPQLAEGKKFFQNGGAVVRKGVVLPGVPKYVKITGRQPVCAFSTGTLCIDTALHLKLRRDITEDVYSRLSGLQLPKVETLASLDHDAGNQRHESQVLPKLAANPGKRRQSEVIELLDDVPGGRSSSKLFKKEKAQVIVID